MNHIRYLFLVLLTLPAIVMANKSLSIGKITGKVTDAETKTPLYGVVVQIATLKKGVLTDTTGTYTFDNLHEGVFSLTFSLIGYAQVTRTVTLNEGEVRLNVELVQSALQLPGITVTAKPQATDVLASPQSVAALEGKELERTQGATIGELIKNIPGVSTYSTGAGIVKPVVRGLTSQRVVVVSDGVRQEGQQWADEHGPEIDAADVEKIEVVRGPGSVLYGSDALGGVINVVKPELLTTTDGSSILRGTFESGYSSNNNQLSGMINLNGASGGFGYRGVVSARNSGNISTPAGSLSNTGYNELNGGAAVGLRNDWSTFLFDYTHFGTRLEIFKDPADAPNATPYQRVIHDKVDLHGNLVLEGVRLDVIGSYQRNWRREWEEKNSPEPSLELVSGTMVADIKAHHRPIGNLFGTIGISLSSQNFESKRENRLIPNSLTNNYAAFLFEEFYLPSVTVAGGVRVDHRVIDVRESEELTIPSGQRTYTAVSGSVGGSVRPAENLALSSNISFGWRAPTTFELFANGVHEGTASYEIGDSRIRPEQSFNVDISVRYITSRILFEASMFRNTIDNFVFGSPTGMFDSASTFQIYRFEQAKATLLGGELSIKTQIADWCILSLGADIVRGNNDQTGTPLPRIPAARILPGIRVQGSSLGFMNQPYLDVSGKITVAQRRIDPLEIQTGGYTLLDIGFCFELPISDQTVHLGITLSNVFDRAYVDHLNRYKLYALNPGRSIRVKMLLPFAM